jgi:hypothetical protein
MGIEHEHVECVVPTADRRPGPDGDAVAVAQDGQIVVRDRPVLGTHRALTGEHEHHRRVGRVPRQHQLSPSSDRGMEIGT